MYQAMKSDTQVSISTKHAKILFQIFKNIIDHPEQPKYRKINLSKVTKFFGSDHDQSKCIQTLQLLGFVQNGKHLEYLGDLPVRQVLSRIVNLDAKALIDDDLTELALRCLQAETQRILDDQYHKPWTCYMCKKLNLTSNDDRKKCLSCQSLNPLWLARKNKSQSFVVKVPFGIRLKLLSKEVIQKLDSKDTKNLRVVIVASSMHVWEFWSEPGKTRLIDFKHVLAEIIKYQAHGDKRSYLFELLNIEEWNCQPFNDFRLKNDDIIPLRKNGRPYLINVPLNQRLAPKYTVKYMHKLHYGQTKPCEYLEKLQVNKSDRVDVSSCPFVNGTMGDVSDDQILQHLSEYDHFTSFHTKPAICPYGNQCKSFINTVSGEETSFEEKRHLHLYYHPSKRRLSQKNFDESVQAIATPDGVQSKVVFFEYGTINDMFKFIMQRHMTAKQDVKSKTTPDRQLFSLIYEIIDNGFSRDLIPQTDIDYKTRADQSGYVKGQTNEKFFQSPEFEILLKEMTDPEKFKIFDIVEKKQKHPRHKLMEFVLNSYLMLSLLMYTNGDCNYDMSHWQRQMGEKNVDKSVNRTKWKCLEEGIHLAITQLSVFEHHNENIYTGICGVLVNIDDIAIARNASKTNLWFHTFVSFSSSYQIATEFRGAEGVLLGLNIQKLSKKNPGYFKACDVSWISQYPDEKEILVCKGSRVPIFKTQDKFFQLQKNQWFVCDNESIFQNMFVTSKFASWVQKNDQNVNHSKSRPEVVGPSSASGMSLS